MNVFISYSHFDKKYAELIAKELKKAKHKVWIDTWKLRAGDNWIEKINEGLKETDALIVIVSENSLRSESVNQEISAIAFGDISNKQRRIIPVLVDKAQIPSFLAKYIWIDFTSDAQLGLKQLVQALAEKPIVKESSVSKTASEDDYIKALSVSLREGRLTLVCGAGVSIKSGIPSWNDLLLTLLETMMNKISSDKSISLKNADPDEFQKRYSPSALIVGKYLKQNLGTDFLPNLRDALYTHNPTSCDVIDAIVELARPQRDGSPLDSIITFNFDGLIEENLHNHNIRNKTIYSEGVRINPNEIPIYHVHGYLPRNGKISKDMDVVFSEDAYHSQFIDSFSWSNLIQLNTLSQNTCLFLGLSLTDPNLRRLLDVASRKNISRTLNHYIIKKVPNFSNKNDTLDELAQFLEEQDANGLGLNVLWINDFSEIAPLLLRIVNNQ
ncbi:MAG: TIR domain-containing protein [Chloroflexi bacterium]|nr:TIR domain-containing protein [Chloroflexota bacterium]